MPDWRGEQWMVMVTLCVTHLCNGMCVSLQAPFYPAEAEKKGASATQYGLVFGIFELTVFIVSPIMGKLLPKVMLRKLRKHVNNCSVFLHIYTSIITGNICSVHIFSFFLPIFSKECKENLKVSFFLVKGLLLVSFYF